MEHTSALRETSKKLYQDWVQLQLRWALLLLAVLHHASMHGELQPHSSCPHHASVVICDSKYCVVSWVSANFIHYTP